jgi:hypothetical protein
MLGPGAAFGALTGVIGSSESWQMSRSRFSSMRSFLIACLVGGLLAAGAAYVLNTYVQEPVSEAFSTTGTRL